uniref:(California timema) hypothetical protein n=1 Tax=Timema californicum TaxID=61474 RepID=A0A7R9P592_TIMCA|nr:unnamed protein product [Timema californicum]
MYPLVEAAKGHKLEEIRVRALNHIISKLNYGFIQETDLAASKELVKKLIEWFNFETCPQKETVLNLILKLLKPRLTDLSPLIPVCFLQEIKEIGVPECDALDAKSLNRRNRHLLNLRNKLKKRFQQEYLGLLALSKRNNKSTTLFKIGDIADKDGNVVRQLKKSTLIETLNKVRKELGDSEFCSLVDELVNIVTEFQDVEHEGHLQGLQTLSQRSEIGSTATTFEVKVRQPQSVELFQNPSSNPSSTTGSGVHYGLPQGHGSRPDLSAQQLRACFPHLVLPWQPLVSTDRHVLEAVESSLNNVADTGLVLHSCLFFTDVMLQDFPAEVFLHRPLIVKAFFELLDSSKPAKLRSAVVRCLTKLTTELRVRIQYYTDPCVSNFKQETCLDHTSNISTPSMVSSQSFQTGEGSNENNPATGDYLKNYGSEASLDTGGQPKTTSEAGVSSNEDSVFLQLHQLSLPQYCLLGLYHALPFHKEASGNITTLVAGLVDLLFVTTTPAIWLCSDAIALEVIHLMKLVLALLGDILEQYGTAVNDGDGTMRLGYLQLIALSRKLLVVLVPQDLAVLVIPRKLKAVLLDSLFDLPLTTLTAVNDGDGTMRLGYLQLIALSRKLLVVLVPQDLAVLVIPRKLKAVLLDSLFDLPLTTLYPNVHTNILNYAKKFDDDREKTALCCYNETVKLCNSMRAAVKFLKDYDKLQPGMFFVVLEEALTSLPLHRNLNMVRYCVAVCAKKMNGWSLDEDTHQVCTNVFLKLLAHGEEDIKEEMYSCCHESVLATLGVDSVHSSKSAAQLVFLFNTRILIEIICHGATSTNNKGKFLMSDQMWRKFLENLIPALPLLLCYADKVSALGRSVSKMLDPDVSSSILLPTLTALKGNLCLLFSTEPSLRDEAIARLTWLLTKEEKSYEKFPNFSALRGVVLNNICMVEKPLKMVDKRTTGAFYEASSLCQVVELLESSFVEPLVRKSALTQISAMLEDPSLHTPFMEQGGVETVLKIFQSAMVEKEFNNYPDSAIPVISILKNLAHFNPGVRHELSAQESVFYCIIRAVLLFHADKNLCQNVAQLLCLLLYSDYVLPVPESASSSDGGMATPRWYPLSLPNLVVERMRLPFICHTHWKSSQYTQPSLTGVLSDQRTHRMLRNSWNLEWFGSLGQLLSWKSCLPVPDSSKDLMLLETDLDCLKATFIPNNLRRCLFNVQNATTHQAVISSLDELTRYITLHTLLYGKSRPPQGDNTSRLENVWYDLPWEDTFLRFLVTPPACLEDKLLLVAVLDFLTLYLKMCSRAGLKKKGFRWMTHVLKDPGQPLPNLLKMEGEEDTPCKELYRALLALCQDCASLESRLEDVGTVLVRPVKKGRTWGPLVKTIMLNLKLSDTQHFYNLGRLTTLKQENDKLFPNSNHTSWLSRSNCGKGGASSASFMGLAITRSAMLCLNHLLCEMHNSDTDKNWDAEWMSVMTDSHLLWLPYLWANRDPVVRAAGFQLVAGLCMSLRACVMLQDGIDLEQAATLLTNLTSHKINNGGKDGGSTVSVSCKSIGNNEEVSTGIEALVSLLDRHSLYPEMATLLSRLYLGSTVTPDGRSTDVARWTVESLSGRRLAQSEELHPGEFVLVYNRASSKTENYRVDYACSSWYGKHFFGSAELSESVSEATTDDLNLELQAVTTPSVVKAVSLLLVNLISLSPTHALFNMKKCGLVRLLFCCLGSVRQFAKKDMMLYVDVLEMYTGVCCVLSKCVALDDDCHLTVLHTHNSLTILLSLLDPVQYERTNPEVIFLRNRVWSEVFRLLTALLLDTSKHSKKAYKAICDALWYVGHQPFFAALKTSVCSESSADLQSSALTSLISLLTQESKVIFSPRTEDPDLSIVEIPSVNSLQSLLDEDHSESCDLNKVPSLEILEENSCDRQITVSDKDRAQDRPLHGAELCDLLLRLYEVHSLQLNMNEKNSSFGKGPVVGALSSLLLISHEAKHHALREGLLATIILQARELHVCPLLRDIGALFGLLTNFMHGSTDVKTAAAEQGLADLVHKVWLWCTAVPGLLVDTLNMMCTFTNRCLSASHSLVLTTTIPGVGLRKTPSSVSLFHAVVSLVLREMDMIGPAHEQNVLALAFQLLRHACHSHECRLVMTKSSLLQGFNQLHPSRTKKQKHWEGIESLWLHFLLDFTYHPEGQLVVPKVPEMFDLIMMMTKRRGTKLLSLSVLRNITFHQFNRPRLLSSGEFLQVLHQKLSEGSTEEKGMVASMIWSLVANNQKGKLIVKCSGLDTKLQEAVNQLTLTSKSSPSQSKEKLQIMNYVLRILNTDEKNKKK